jgi:TIR domain
MTKVFISYRRDDARYPAKELFRSLSQHVRDPKTDIFLDIDSIPRGVDFVEYLASKVEQSEIMIVLIGANWLDARDGSGERRLDDPEDFVRLEISSALKCGIPVVPVLLDGTPMPRSDALPTELQSLVRRQAEEIRLNTFEADVARLVRSLPIDLKAVSQVAATVPQAQSSNQAAPVSFHQLSETSIRSNRPQQPRHGFPRFVGILLLFLSVSVISVFAMGRITAGSNTTYAARSAMVAACTDSGESLTNCTCIADSLEKGLDKESFKVVAAAMAAGEAEGEQMINELPTEKQGAVMGALMSAGLACMQSGETNG